MTARKIRPQSRRRFPLSLYLTVDLLILAFPLALSFDSRVHFFTRWPAVFSAILAVGVLFVAWDALAAARGDWSFNPRYVGKKRIFGLPLEEILFFVAVPYACLFVYECVAAYFPKFSVPYSLPAYLAAASLFLALALVFRKKYYTFTLGLFTAASVALLGIFFRADASSSDFWFYILLTYVPFAISNGVLTAVPVVRYNPKSILGLRIGSIPAEDFLYSFSLLSLEFMAYRFFLSVWRVS